MKLCSRKDNNMNRKNVLGFTNDVLALVEENQRLKNELQLVKSSLSPEQTIISEYQLFLVEFGQKLFFEKVLKEVQYYSELNLYYTENGVDKTFEQWFKTFVRYTFTEFFRDDLELPIKLSLQQIQEMLKDLAKDEYEKRRNKAQLEYARKIKEEKNES